MYLGKTRFKLSKNTECKSLIKALMKGKVLVAQSCPTLHDLMDSTPPGSSAPGFPRQEYWSGLPFPSPGDIPDPGIKLGSPFRRILYHLSHQGNPKVLIAK